MLSVYDELSNKRWNIRCMLGRIRSVDHWACSVEKSLMEVNVEVPVKIGTPYFYKLNLNLRKCQD